MDIAQAQIILNTAIKTRTDEIAAFNLALGVLNDTFKVDFVNLDSLVAEKEAALTTISSLTTQVDLLEAQIPEVKPVTLPVEPLTP